MESRMTKISARGDKKIQLKVIPGDFATPRSHITHYLDLTTMRSRSSEALRVAEALAANYETSIPVDTIICMSGLEVVGAYLAETLTRAGVYSMNSHQTIYITAPEYNNSGQIIFRDNIQPMIKNKNVLLLLASATTGKTIKQSIECIEYYGGSISGISAIFSATDEVAGHEVHSLFSKKDIDDYASYSVDECPMCKAGKKIEAIVNSYGYSML